MGLKRGQRLRLQRVEAAVELVAPVLVRTSWPTWRDAIGSGDLDIENRGHRAPDVGNGLIGRPRRRRAGNRRAAVEELDVRWQRDRDSNEAVLRQIREVVRGCAIDAEIISVYRARQRIVDTGRGHLVEPRLSGRRGQLEVLR